MLKVQEDIQKFKSDLDKLEKVMTRNQEIARNLFAEGMEIKSIIKITGLTEEEIRKLGVLFWFIYHNVFNFAPILIWIMLCKRNPILW